MQITIVTPEKGITYQEQLTAIKSNKSDSSFSDALNTATSNVNINSALGVPQELTSIFQQAAEKYGVSYNLLVSMAKQESGFNANATSSSGAQGIMQLMPATAAGLGVTNAYDPYQNIMAGAQYIANKLQEFNGDVSLALAAYNAGSGAVKNYGGIPPYTETQNYVKNILNYMNQAASSVQTSSVQTNSSESSFASNQTESLSNQTADTAMSKAEAAEQLELLLSEFSEHESYDLFMERLAEEMGTEEVSVENIMQNTQDSDAETAYKTLLGSMNRVILSIIDENP